MAVEILASARTALESVRGTSIATATRLFYFANATHTFDVATIAPVDSRGGYIKNYRAYPGVERNSFDFTGDLTYQDAVMLGQLAIGSTNAGTITAGTAYSWRFSPVGTADTNRSATMEFSYADLISTVGWRVPGLVIDELTVTWEKDKPVTWKAKMLTAGTATTITSFTGSLTDRTLVTATGPTWSAYADTTTVGTTADTRIAKAEWTLKNGYKIRDGADGTKGGIEIVKTGLRETGLKISRYFNDTTELNAFASKSTRLFRMQTVGGSVGAGTALYTHRVDFAGVATSHKEAAIDGLVYAEIEYDAIYASGIGPSGNDFDFYVVNGDSTIS